MGIRDSDMRKGLANLYTGHFNTVRWEHQLDGSVAITLTKRGDGKTYHFRVKDLYGEHEEVLEHEVTQKRGKPWIAERIKRAKEEKERDVL